MDIEFSSLEELYRRMEPALHTKREEMHRNGYPYIKIEDIWDYLTEMKWVHAKDLALYQMVSDVLNAPDEKIETYLREKHKLRNRKNYDDIEEDVK